MGLCGWVGHGDAAWHRPWWEGVGMLQVRVHLEIIKRGDMFSQGGWEIQGGWFLDSSMAAAELWRLREKLFLPLPGCRAGCTQSPLSLEQSGPSRALPCPGSVWAAAGVTSALGHQSQGPTQVSVEFRSQMSVWCLPILTFPQLNFSFCYF